MRTIYLASAALLATACSQAEETVEAEMGLTSGGGDEYVEGRTIDGRWGIQYEACSDENETGDGVILISQYDVIIGMDACSITGVTESDGVFEINGMCDGAEGESYEETFYFSTPQQGVLRWDNRNFNRVEDYVMCDGGAMH